MIRSVSVGRPRSGTAGREIAERLAAVAASYTPEARAAKLELLARLEATRVSDAGALLALHEACCFLQAHPDDAAVLARVDAALAAFPERVRRLAPGARRRLHDSGVAEATLDYPFGYPMARWLARRFPGDVEIAWDRFAEAERLDETLALLASPAEGDAFSEGGMGWRRWLTVAKGGRRMTDLALLLELFGRAGGGAETREWLWENLALPVQWRPQGPGASRTLARLLAGPPFFHADGLRRAAPPPAAALVGPLPTLRRAPRALGETLIDAARVAMATRQRELHAFSHPNPDDVLVVDAPRGLRIAYIGIAPGFRLPLEGYYAFLALKNGVPVSYGGGWELFGTLDFAMNIFPSFRQGESALLATALLRGYRRIFGMRTIVVDRYQLGHESAEALRSGSFYFYQRLGFRPRAAAVLRVLEGEEAKLAADHAYRSPVPVLRRLAGAEVFLSLPGGLREPERRLRATDVAGMVAHLVARDFGGDRRRARGALAVQMARALGVRRRGWSAPERRAFDDLSLVAALIPDLPRWPAADRDALVQLMRAKGGPTEIDYAHRLDRHVRFRRSLESLREA